MSVRVYASVTREQKTREQNAFILIAFLLPVVTLFIQRLECRQIFWFNIPCSEAAKSTVVRSTIRSSIRSPFVPHAYCIPMEALCSSKGRKGNKKKKYFEKPKRKTKLKKLGNKIKLQNKIKKKNENKKLTIWYLRQKTKRVTNEWMWNDEKCTSWTTYYVSYQNFCFLRSLNLILIIWTYIDTAKQWEKGWTIYLLFKMQGLLGCPKYAWHHSNESLLCVAWMSYWNMM